VLSCARFLLLCFQDSDPGLVCLVAGFLLPTFGASRSNFGDRKIVVTTTVEMQEGGVWQQIVAEELHICAIREGRNPGTKRLPPLRHVVGQAGVCL